MVIISCMCGCAQPQIEDDYCLCPCHTDDAEYMTAAICLENQILEGQSSVTVNIQVIGGCGGHHCGGHDVRCHGHVVRMSMSEMIIVVAGPITEVVEMVVNMAHILRITVA